ncbi:hypothetical protein [Streptomyces sp. NPDC051162]|uniref:recombination directionality factor n=1 Tax=Streptomyces sp. NPDC051162 TaxID=3154747 RepID=UPI00343C574A
MHHLTPGVSQAALPPVGRECSGRQRRHTVSAHDHYRSNGARRQRHALPHTRTESRTPEAVEGDFDFGRVIDGKLHSQPVWRLITASARAAEGVASLFGVEPQRRPVNGSEQLEVVSQEAGLQVAIDGPESLTTQMKSWDSRGLAHHCDGRVFLSPASRARRSCGCPSLMEERKARARLGHGPQPITTLLLRLTGGPDLGLFRFRSSSWRFAETVEEIRTQLADLRGPSLCDLAVEAVEFTTSNGRSVCYQKPAVRVLGPWTPGTPAGLDT